MDQSLLAYVGLLAVAAAVAIVVSVGLVADTSASEETKKLLSAVTTAVTTFLGAVVLASDKSDAALGDAIKAEFFAAYDRDDDANPVPPGERYIDSNGKRRFPGDSDGLNAVYGAGWRELSGWDASTRLKRARIIQEYMNEA